MHIYVRKEIFISSFNNLGRVLFLIIYLKKGGILLFNHFKGGYSLINYLKNEVCFYLIV